MKQLKNQNPSVQGFKAAGLNCGIKENYIKDLALVISEVSANAAAVFTKNRVVSPSVTWSRNAITKSGRCRAVIVNSGNANAVSGSKGLKDCDEITKKVQLCDACCMCSGTHDTTDARYVKINNADTHNINDKGNYN